jgi:DNA invertase Pin-like site-specific DNA recombinase
MRAAIYARYSSDLQSEASIEDQVRLCRERIEQENGSVTKVYTDRAISGGSLHNRPGMKALLIDAQGGRFDVVIAEALDRISRDQEDTAAIFKRLAHADARILTLAEGDISELHVGLKGTMNALFLKDLAQKTHRGLEGRVRQGLSGGGIAFGYDVIRKSDAGGQPIRGKRRINDVESVIVRRIFQEFAQGHSPRAIARILNAEGIPGPKGRPWQDTTIRGHATRRTGILRNDLYAGRLVWNKQHYVKNPSTGNRVARPNPEDRWIVEPVPDLRIVDDALWCRVQERLKGIRASDRVSKARKTKFWEHRRARHLLTGLLHCSTCGSPLTSVGKDYLACGKARRTGVCDNQRGIRRLKIEEAVLQCLKKNLMRPHLVEEFIRAFHEEVNKQRNALEHGFTDKKRRLAVLNHRLDGLYDAIADGLRTPGLKAKLEELEAQKATLQHDIDAAPLPAPQLHPNLAELYRRKVDELHRSLNDPACQTEAAETLRGIIEGINVKPLGRGAFEMELVGEIANMIDFANSDVRSATIAPEGPTVPDPYRSSVKVVAGARNHRELTVSVAI